MGEAKINGQANPGRNGGVYFLPYLRIDVLISRCLSVDVYIYKYSQADISHSICPDCMRTHYADEFEDE